MITHFLKWYVSIFILIFCIASCSGTKLTHKEVNENFTGKPVSSILVIGIADNPKNRQSFENRFVNQLKAIGVEAESSADVIPMPADLKLNKEDILAVVKKYNNDAVIVTHVKSAEDNYAATRDAPSRTNFYSYYGYVFGYRNSPSYSSVSTTVRLETNLYDVNTEQLIWSGVSKTWNKDSKNEIINDVISVVIDELNKNKLLQKK